MDYANIVPVRIEVDYDEGSSKIKDVLCWDLAEESVKPSDYALVMVQDHFGTTTLNSAQLETVKQIEESIQQQISIHIDAMHYFSNSGFTSSVCDVNILLRMGNVCLQDRFKWDVLAPFVSPEEFSRTMVADLSLPPDFAPLIAHSIREQIDDYIRYCAQTIRARRGIRGLDQSDDALFRDSEDATLWAPVLSQLDKQEIERLDDATNRERRHKRRQNEAHAARMRRR